jgi:hypothetical protein
MKFLGGCLMAIGIVAMFLVPPSGSCDSACLEVRWYLSEAAFRQQNRRRIDGAVA